MLVLQIVCGQIPVDVQLSVGNVDSVHFFLVHSQVSLLVVDFLLLKCHLGALNFGNEAMILNVTN